MHTVLVVDDAPDILTVIAEYLTEAGYDVLTAPGIEAALTVLRTCQPIHLMLSDIKMPGNGHQLVPEVERLYPAMPVILMTGYADVAELQTHLILRKPFRMNALVAAIAARLDAKTAPVDEVLPP